MNTVLLHEHERLEADVLRDGEGPREGEAVRDDELLYDDSHGTVSRGYDVQAQRSERVRRTELARRGLVRAGDVMLGKYVVEKAPARSRGVIALHAKHMDLGHRVLIKFLAPESSTFPERVGRFLREARAAVRIQSEHVAKVTDVGRLRSGAPYMVIEHPRGSDLAEVLRVRTALTVVEAVDYMIQACEAVSEAHSLGIIHGNLSPTNLVLSRRPDDTPLIKVMGFGGSQSAILDSFSMPAESEGNDLVETLPYVAPEQIRNATEADGRTDVWAFGAILHELLTGSPVYEAATAPALLAQIAADPPMSVTEWRPDVPLELDAVIQHCLDKDPVGRYPSIGELVHSLAPFSSSDSRTALERVTRIIARGGRSIPPPLPSSVPPRSRPLPPPSTPQRRNSALVHVGSNPPPAPAASQAASRTMLPVVFLALGLGGGVAFGAEYARNAAKTLNAAAAPSPTLAPVPAPLPVTAPAQTSVPLGAAAAAALTAAPVVAALTPAALTPVPVAAPVVAAPAPVVAPAPAPAPVAVAAPVVRPAPAVAQRPPAAPPAKPAERSKPKTKAEDAPEPNAMATRGKDLFDDLN